MRPTCRREQRAENAIGVGDNMWPRIQQRSEISRVDVEVVTARRAWRIAPPVGVEERPPGLQPCQTSPRRPRACPTVDEKHLWPQAFANHADRRHVSMDLVGVEPTPWG